MQLYPGWSARDNYVGVHFFSAPQSVETYWGIPLPKGSATCHLKSGLRTILVLHTPGTRSILSEPQSGRLGEGRGSSSWLPVRLHQQARVLQGGGRRALFCCSSSGAVHAFLPKSSQRPSSGMCLSLLSKGSWGLTGKALGSSGASLIPPRPSSRAWALKREKRTNCPAL